uniref:Cell surface glycoprotein n=1 Tax=uncultured haloarchaeon TaxID=160804 RepID=A0A0K1YAT6_9EURY|nr:hypothetical protein [uncultured haloarchaeon]
MSVRTGVFCILLLAMMMTAGAATSVTVGYTEQPHSQTPEELDNITQPQVETPTTGSVGSGPEILAQTTETPANTTPQNNTTNTTETETPTPPPNGTETETPTPTPTSTPIQQSLLVTGSIENPSPPGSTAVETTITLQFDTQIATGTLIEFDESYSPDDIQIESLRPTRTNATGAVTGRVQQSSGGGNDTSRPQIRLTPTGSVKDIETVLTIQHPRVQNDTQYQLIACPPATENETESNNELKTTLVSYTVRPVGDDRRSGLTSEFDRLDGSGFVYQNATVYQGEADIEFRGALDPPLRGISGNTDGKLLSPPIPTDAPTGAYSSDGTNETAAIRVQTPKMNTLRVENAEDVDISGGRVYPETTDTLTVTAQSNFEDAEEIELTVRNSDNLDITEEIIDTARARPETPNGNPPIQAALQSNPNRERQLYSHQDRFQFLTAEKTASSSTYQFNANYPSIKSTTLAPSSPFLSPTIAASTPTLAQTTGSITPKREITQTKVDTGKSVEVTLTGIVDDDGGILFEEAFSPAITGANTNVEINNVASSAGSFTTVVKGATSEGVVVVLTNAPSGEIITVTYTIQVGQSDATYRISGSVTGKNTEKVYDETALVVGSGGNTEVTSNGKVSWELDLSTIETDSLAISVSGSDDFTSQESTASTNIGISYASASLQPGTSRPARGQTLGLSITNSAYGRTHAVIIPVSDLRSTVDANEYDEVFRNVGTTQTTGIITRSGEQVTGRPNKNVDPIAVFAQLEIDSDDGVGKTQVRTGLLSDTTTIELLDSSDPTRIATTGRSIDTVDLSVIDASTTLTAPETYTTQSETTIKGDISSGVDTVVMYVETNAGFEQIDLDDQSNGDVSGTSVSGESFSHELTLSRGDGPGNEVLSLPGTYQVVIRAKASLLSDQNDDIPEVISKPAMLSGETSTQRLVVQDTAITLDRPGLDGSIATTESLVTLSGTAEGQEEALIIAIGDRGEIETAQVDGPNFSDVDMRIGDFASGIVTVYALSAGRDGEIGDGTLNEDRIGTLSSSPLDELTQHLSTIAESGASGKQLRAILHSETDLDTASDDPVVMRELLVSDPEITIEHPTRNQSIADDTIQVRGTTNIRSENAQIEVDLRQRGNITADAYIRQWNESSWNTTISIPNNASGQYALTADIGRTAVGRRIMIQDSSGTTSNSLSTDANALTTPSVAGDGSGEETTQAEQVQRESTTLTPNANKTPVDIAKTSHDDNPSSTGNTTLDSNMTTSTEAQTNTSASTRTLSLAQIILILAIGCVSIMGWIQSQKP